MDFLKPDPSLYGLPFSADSFHGMPYRRLGNSGLRVSRMGLGTWKFGFPETGDGARVDAGMGMRIFDRALELGVTFWDTANRYNDSSGNSERLIGQWLKANPDQRRNVVIATKMCGGMDGISPNHSRLSRGNILDSVCASLQRLQLDYVDVLYFHRFDGEAPAEESLCAVEDLVRQGLVRHLAVSNFTVEQLQLYRRLEQAISPRVRVVAVQNRFDILGGEAPSARGVLDLCAECGISFVPYSPLARGLLTGRYLDPARARAGDRLVDEGTLGRDATAPVLAALRELAEVARSLDLELSQLALAYALSLPGMGPQIPSSSTPRQLESNAKAAQVELPDEARAKIRTTLAALPQA